jgi:hypothetical protein
MQFALNAAIWLIILTEFQKVKTLLKSVKWTNTNRFAELATTKQQKEKNNKKFLKFIRILFYFSGAHMGVAVIK